MLCEWHLDWHFWHLTVALQFQQYAEQGEGKKKGPVRTDVVSRAVEQCGSVGSTNRRLAATTSAWRCVDAQPRRASGRRVHEERCSGELGERLRLQRQSLWVHSTTPAPHLFAMWVWHVSSIAFVLTDTQTVLVWYIHRSAKKSTWICCCSTCNISCLAWSSITIHSSFSAMQFLCLLAGTRLTKLRYGNLLLLDLS